MNATLNRQFHALINKKGLKSQKADLVSQITNRRTESSKELTDGEARELINKLTEGDVPLSKSEQIALAYNNKTKEDRQRQRCFFLFRKMGYTNPDDKPNYEHIDNFCKVRTAAKVPLLKMDTQQLTALIFQLEKIVKTT